MTVFSCLLFYLGFSTPLWTIPMIKKFMNERGPYILVGLAMAFVISLMMMLASIGMYE